ncbi:MAG: hypothetical protein LWY06_04045 [Firmicutes bacterium]|nr:hypothetical protein [Bacillota bacterium]
MEKFDYEKSSYPLLMCRLIKAASKLPESSLHKVVDLAEDLKSLSTGTPGKDFIKIRGLLSKEEARELNRIIKDGCGSKMAFTLRSSRF